MTATTVTAAVLAEPHGRFELTELALEAPRSDEVLVRVVATGVCQTDVHVKHRELPFPLPGVLGHEGAGIVERVGADVRSLRTGDHVVLTFMSCGACPTCLAGSPAYCLRSFEANGSGRRLDGSSGWSTVGPDARHEVVHGHFFGQSSFATHALVNERNAVKVVDEAPLELLGPLGCGLQTGAGTVLNALAVPAGASIAVFGTGAVGLAAVMASRIAGAATIVGVDVRDDRLELARELGATHTIDASAGDVVDRVRAIAALGVDFVVDTTARPEMLGHAVDAVAPCGTVALVGGAPFGTRASIDMNSLLLGRTVRGVVQGASLPHQFIPRLVDLHLAGRFPIDRLAKAFDFVDIDAAVGAIETGQVVKPIVRIAS